MNFNQFQIFKKQDQENTSPINLPFLIIGLTIVAVIFLNKYSEPKRIENLEIYAIILGLGISAIVKRNQKTEKKKELNQLSGIIEFQKEKIIIEEKEYLIKEIEKITLSVDDYLNKMESSGLRGLPPRSSSGTRNYCFLKLRNQTEKKVFFQIRKRDEFLNLRAELIEYYQQGKISWLKLLELLRIEKYEEIQEFKKKLQL